MLYQLLMLLLFYYFILNNKCVRDAQAVFSMLSTGLDIVYSSGTAGPFEFSTLRSTGNGGLTYRMSSCFATSRLYAVNLALL